LTQLLYFLGNDSSLFEFPWAALIGYEKKQEKKLEFNCGGSIISGIY
jgi:hypothetical protein